MSTTHFFVQEQLDRKVDTVAMEPRQNKLHIKQEPDTEFNSTSLM